MSIQETINQLQVYQGSDKPTLYPGANENLLRSVEGVYGVTLPDDFKELYRFSDGFATDEDLFNLIPLAEIVSNKVNNKDSPLYIAEYMIYSDMWRLEINPDNCNDYKIMVEANDNQLMLTNSLAEFINRFLTGGVFETGGLYTWQQEIEALPIYSTKLTTVKFLITVFYYGLRYNLIHEKEVIDWADRLIMHEDEPDPFFIDLSLGHDKKGLINLLYPVTVTENGITARATLGLLYHRLSQGATTVKNAIDIINGYNFLSPLTKSEVLSMYDLTNYGEAQESVEGNYDLTERILRFLANYKEFEIASYKSWYSLNSRIEYRFRKDEKHLTIQAPKEQPDKNKINIDWMPSAIIYSMALISFIVLVTTHPLVKNKLPISSFRSDLYKISQPFFYNFRVLLSVKSCNKFSKKSSDYI